MAAFSTLRLANVSQKLLQLSFARSCGNALANPSKTLALQPVRRMGHGRVMSPQPSRYEWKSWKDLVHFYVTLAAIPIAAILLYSNLVVGRAELSEIPEDYTPEHWEYFPHPVTRFIARYIHEKPEKNYEVGLHILNEKNEKRKMTLLEHKVKRLMGERQDVRTWNFRPFVNEDAAYSSYKIKKESQEMWGKND